MVPEMELFFIVWMRLVSDVWMRWCVEAGGVGTKLRLRRVLQLQLVILVEKEISNGFIFGSC